MKNRQLALGLTSGTSMHGIDVALVETDGTKIFKRGPGASYKYEPPVRNLIAAATAAATGKKLPSRSSGILAEAEQALTKAHARAVRTFLEKNHVPAGRVNIIGFHGQTLLHRPEKRLSIQLGDGQALADACDIDVVYDFRAADMVAGGEGAPFAPVYHQALAAQSGLELPVAIVNVGGVANVTWIGQGGAFLAFTAGPGNALIDEWVERFTGQQMDQDGRIAGRGKANATAIEAFLGHEYFSKAPPKSVDRRDFSVFLVEGMGIADAAATLTGITAESIARSVDHIPEPPRHWVISGGGSRNPALMIALRTRLEGRVETAQTIGWSSDFMEAEAFAYMAVRSLHDLPLTFPETTGVPEPLCGGILVSPAERSTRRPAIR